MTKKEIAMEIKKDLKDFMFTQLMVELYGISWETFNEYVQCEKIKKCIYDGEANQDEALDILNNIGDFECGSFREYYFEGNVLKQKDYTYYYKIKE